MAGSYREKEVDYLIDYELKPAGITDEKVLNAIRKVRREKFIPESLRNRAYGNYPLPIGENQTISQPYIVALMTQALEIDKNDKVLEIGTGSGYQAAILAELARIVYTVERIPSLLDRARTNLYSQGYDNIILVLGDGTQGLPEYAPYDKIIVTAAAPKIPEPLIEQLKGGGKMVIPVGDRFVQDLKLVEKALNGRIYQKSLGGCRFVPLIGKEGWKD
ncbi:MAG: protein-L-isoaspartate O-methyltransferase [Spirochaetes bacterium]|nr:MAG: protein-L-isoaspartate O-methyltransferase [Spirochaetota bacterium]RKY03035.1 MAG: protein-L-isoaspartate O-methyltransferase [Spirochaetota bacterium]